MSTLDNLPIIIVSAVNETTAANILSELIDNEVTDIYCKEPVTHDRVWRLQNKYYRADVRLHTLTDGRQLELDIDRVEAHVIHVTNDEMSSSTAAAGRAQAGRAAWRAARVRLLLADGAAEPRALAAWAAAARAELVPLREAGQAGQDGQGGQDEPLAWDRARAALHAHTWRGLVRRDRPPPPSPPSPSDRESSEEEEDEEEEEEERAVERAEAFAAALGALGEAREARGGAGEAGEALEARRDRAEALLAAFCRALGLDADRC